MKGKKEQKPIINEVLQIMEPVIDWAVKKAARHLHGDNGRVLSPDDLRSEAVLGILKSYPQYEPRLGSVNNFFRPRVVGAIWDTMRHYATGSQGVMRKYASMQRTGKMPEGLSAAFQRRVQNFEPYKFLNKDILEMSEFEQSVHNLSLEYDHEEGIDLDRKREWLRGEINKQPPRTRAILESYYYRNLTMKETGQRVGLTEQRVQQIISAWLREIKRRAERCVIT